MSLKANSKAKLIEIMSESDNRDLWDPNGDLPDVNDDNWDQLVTCQVFKKWADSGTFMFGFGSDDEDASQDVIQWLVEPIPTSWKDNMSPDQRKDRMNRNWSINSRDKYLYPVTRIEYWSVTWAPSSKMNGSYYRGYQRINFDGSSDSDGGYYSSELRAFNKAEYTAAKWIIHWIWGNLNGSGPSSSGESAKLFEKSSGWTAAERKFADVISINSGRGAIFNDTFLGGMKSDTDYPWAPANEWIPGSGTALGQDTSIYSLVYRLVNDEASYNHPFNPDNMGYLERVIMSKGNYDEPGGPSVEEGLAQFREDYTIANFEKGVFDVLTNLDDPSKTKVWDGNIPESADAAQVVVEENLFLMYTDADKRPDSRPGSSPKASTLFDRAKVKGEEHDWDSGVAYSEKRSNEKSTADSGGTPWWYDFNAGTTINRNTMGLARIVHMLGPLGSAIWTGNRHDQFNEYRQTLAAIWSAGAEGYLKEAEAKHPGMKQAGSARGNKPLAVRDSGFIDWKSYMASADWKEQTKNYSFINKNDEAMEASSGYLANTGRFYKEAVSYLPRTVVVKDSSSGQETNRISLENSTLDLKKDVIDNQEPENTLAFTGNRSAITTDSEDVNKVIDEVMDSFYKFAGSNDTGFGGPDSASRDSMIIWLKENLTNSVYPSVNETPANVTLNLGGSDPSVIGLPNDESGKKALDALKSALEGDTVYIEKGPTPWFGLTKSGIGLIDFRELLNRYVASAYVTFFFYRKHKKGLTAAEKSEQGSPNIDGQIIWDHYKTLCAYHMMRIWAKVVHDNEVGNFYGLIVTLLATGKLNAAEADALAKALAALAGASADEMTKDLGTDAGTEVDDLPPDDASKDQRERFYKQCALLLNMHTLKFHKSKLTGPYHEQSVKAGFTTYNGRLHQLTNEGGNNGKKNNILNKLISPKPEQISSFLDITPAQASNLLPYVRFYKVWNNKAKELEEREFDFPLEPRIHENHPEFDRGDGVGVKEFSWEYDGETPATASKYIKAKLTLYFQTFDDFVKKRFNNAGKSFRWVDMFVSPTAMIANEEPKYNTPHHLKYDPEYYRIRVDVGYNSAGMPKALGNALQRQNASFFLVLVDNEIEINEDMSVNITANYRAYIEEAMDSMKFNALTSPEIEADRKDHKAQWEFAIENYKNGKCSDIQLRSIRNDLNAQMETLIKRQHKAIMTNLLNHGRIFHADFEEPDIRNFRKNGVFGNIPKYSNQAFSTGPDTKAGEFFKNQMKKLDGEPWAEHPEPHKGIRVYYFYLGDLFYLLASNIYKKESNPHISGGVMGQDEFKTGAENTKFLLMDFDYHNSLLEGRSSRQTINIADVPIAVDFFFEWYINNVIKNNVTTMGIGNFIKRMLTEMVTEAMAEVCMTGEEGHYVTFQLGSMSAAGQVIEKGPDGKAAFVDPITKALFMETLKKEEDKVEGGSYAFDVSREYGKLLPLPRVPSGKNLLKDPKNGINGLFNYVFIYGDFADPYHHGRGNEAEDEADGTYHLHLGRDRGLVKNISFSKNNIPYHRESRMFNQGQAGLLQLSAVYDCEIKMVGNTLFLPGMEVFVNPYGFGGPTFGKPQDPPLGFSPSVATIDSVNLAIDDAMADGKLDEGERKAIGNQVRKIQQQEEKDRDKARDGDAEMLRINSYANVMGIGGYQLIIRIKCSIKPGQFETTVNAKHVYTGYPAIKQANRFMDYRNSQPNDVSAADEGGTTGCSAIIRKTESGID